MSNNRNSRHRGLPESEVSEDTNRLLKKLRLIAIFMAGILGRPFGWLSKWSRSIKSSMTIAALVAATVLAGHTMSAQLVVAQTTSLDPLNKVSVPEPDNIGDFIRNKTAAIALGKSLFWDMQLGSDGIQSCASCHFHAGADNRSKNQLNPGQNAEDNNFDIGGRPNYHLTVADYPFRKLADPNNIQSAVVSNSNDVAGSQGVFRSTFVDVVPGSAKDNVTSQPDDVFNVQGTNVRRVTGRHTPTVINAVFNFRNFWDGRAQDVFNGVNPSGSRDPNAFVLKATNPRQLRDERVRLKNSSLASQAVGPPLDAFETFAEQPPDPPFAPFRVSLDEGNNTVRIIDQTSGKEIASDSAEPPSAADAAPEVTSQSQRRPPQQPTTRLNRVGRKLGKKLLALQPLAKQVVAYDDSVLGRLSNSTRNSSRKGLRRSYEALIRDAFQPKWWRSNLIIRVDPETGERQFYRRPRNRSLSTIEYTLPEYNFSLFFGLAIQAYEATLVSDQTPFDKFLAGNTKALTAQQQQGWNIFQKRPNPNAAEAERGGGCIGCHAGSELTAASVSSVASGGRIRRGPPQIGSPAEDAGFFSIGVRPPEEDSSLGGNDEFGNPLSEVRLAQQGTFQQLLGEAPPTLNPSLSANENVVANGAFKSPGLRNVELTAPYFHNGGELTLRQVVDFYSRAGNFGGLPLLNLTEEQKEALVAFMKGLTDERVRFQRAPFDHPQLFVPNGHPGDQNSVTVDSSVQNSNGTRQATDALLEIPAVGRSGGNPLPNFLAASQ